MSAVLLTLCVMGPAWRATNRGRDERARLVMNRKPYPWDVTWLDRSRVTYIIPVAHSRQDRMAGRHGAKVWGEGEWLIALIFLQFALIFLQFALLYKIEDILRRIRKWKSR